MFQGEGVEAKGVFLFTNGRTINAYFISKEDDMKKKVLFGVVLVLALSLTAPAWDVLGHAFIMEQIKGGPQNTNGNELYGITSPDFVNYLLNTPYYDYLYKSTHTDFMRVWNMATTPAAQSLAMGFVAHNGVWGADYPAHYSSLSGDPTKGYIIAKAEALEQAFGQMGVWGQMGLTGDMYLPLRLELCHNIIEYVVDIQIWMTDPGIASRVMAGAVGRAPIMQQLVKTAFGGPLVAFSQKTEARLNHPAALAILLPAEISFQQRVALYAGLYATSDSFDEVLANLDGYLRILASQMFGLTLQPGQAGQLLGAVLQMGLTADAPYELGATVTYVQGQLAAHNIVYGKGGMQTEDKPKGKNDK
jgi:hypothetical protein